MFDAALGESMQEPLVEGFDALHAIQVEETPLFLVPPSLESFQEGLRAAERSIKSQLSEANLHDLLQLFPGTEWQNDSDRGQRLASALGAIIHGELSFSLLPMEGASRATAISAFSPNGPGGAPTIFVNPFWFDSLGEAQATSVLLEEIGHALDNILNGENDSPGDEGRAFARAVLGYDALESLGFANDHGTVTYGGVEYAAEFASFSFVNAYEMLTDRDGDDTVDNTENWAEKEQETHTLVVANNGTDADKGGLGPAIINDDTDSAAFSGNDVVAIGIDIDGITYFGWISRPLKVQGEVVGFYFWTDQNFTTLALAQADGNQDGDRDVTDNKGFVLVVDQTYFTDTIAAGLTAVTVQASTVYSAQPAGTYNTIEVKSSSDRVDAQLNTLLASNSGPTGVDDTTSGTPDASIAGRPALEQGFDLNTGVNAEISAGQDATGNVLTNDSDADGDTLQVASVQSDFSGSTAVPTTSTSAVVVGRYGTLTLSQSGAYRYVVDNANSDVNALLSGSLSESFTYTLSDGNSGSDTATLTVTINGANDAPLAEDDVALAKETLTDGNGVVTLAGFSASGDVLSNDEDADSGDSLSIAGLATSGQIIGTTQGSSSQSATTLSFSSDISKSISVGHFVFFEASGVVNDSNDSAVDLETSSGTHIQVAAIDYASRTITLSDVADSRFNLSSGAILGFTNQSNGRGAYKDAAIAGSINQTTTTFLVDVGGSSGTVAVGMNASATGLEAGVKVTAVNYDGSGVLVSVKLSTTTVLTNTTVSLSGSGAADQQFIGAHGVLLLQGNGTYTYTPFEDNPAIAQGDSVIDRFTYSAQDLAGETSSAELVVTVLGASTSDVVAVADTATVYESGVGRQSSAPYTVTGDNSVFTGVNLNVSAPGVLDNDFGGTVVSYAKADGTDSKSAGVGLTGTYGTLTIQTDGSYTYLLDNSLSSVNGLRETESLTETFRYNTTSNGASTLSISIIGTNDAPIALGDSGSLVEDTTVSASGNALVNDSDVDANDRFTVTAVGVASADQSVSPGTVFSNGTSLSGTYGSLSLGADGSYVYTLADSSDGARYALLQALADGQTVQDSFVYEITDLAGATDSAALTFSIVGANEPPVNSVPTSVTGALNSAINFTGANLVSVADDDGNLNRVTLEVDNGDLNLTADGSLVLSLFDSDGNLTTASGNATVRATLVGTQAEINNTLATLSYTPDAGFSGTDFLTIVSQDAKDAFDSDSVQLLVPTFFVGPTVLESDLGTGSNPSGPGESASLTLSASSNQTFGTVDQTGSDTYGSWSLTTAGLFTYTLTSAPTVSGATEVRSIEVQTFDAFGNSTTNPVSVTITNDNPTANADGASVTEGTSGAPAANITGNVVTGAGTGSVADTASADTPLTVTKVGTTSADGAVTAGTTSADGTSVVGSYGTLVLGADGSYSYDLDDGNATVDGLATGSTLQDVFRYEATDGDGDSSVTTLTITIGGVTDTSPSLTVVDNNGAATGSESVAEDSSLTGKSFTVSAPAGLNKITVAGTDLTLAQLTGASATPVAVTTTEGTLTITGYNSGTGLVTYGFDPTGTSQDHSGGEVSDTISLGVTDSLGQTTSATLQILITDTAPTANADGASVTEGTSGAPAANITGNVVTGAGTGSVADTASADTPLTVTKVGTTSADGAVTAGTTSADGTSVVGSYGTLVLGADGSYSYDLDDGNATVDGLATGSTLQDVFRYEATDGDGDSSVTTLTITIDGVTEVGGSAAFSVNDVTVNEGAGTATFTVTKTGSTNLASTVDVSFADVTAITTGTGDELDFSATATTLTFAAGDTTKTVTVTINDDGVYEGSETFEVNLTNATGATISDAQGIGTILDDGTGSGGTNDDRPSFSINDVTVNEGAGTATFTVTKTGSTNLASTVDVSFADVTAITTGTGDELDFSATATTLTFAAGDTTKTVTVTINDDGVYEGSETFQVNLTNATGATISDAQGIGTILDDGTGSGGTNDDRPSFSINDVTVNEGAGTATFTVTKTGSTNLASTVDVSFADVTAITTGTGDELDFSATATTLTFAAGDTTKTVTVTINDDGVYEGQ
jgi:VCBS repeat-containing protein